MQSVKYGSCDRSRRPTPFEGALVAPKEQGFERILLIDRILQPAASAIRAPVSNLLRIISRIISCCESAGFGGMIGTRLPLRFSGRWPRVWSSRWSFRARNLGILQLMTRLRKS